MPPNNPMAYQSNPFGLGSISTPMPQNPFPAETQGPQLPVQYPQQQPVNPIAQGVQQGAQAYGTYQLGNQILGGSPATASSMVPSATVSTPAVAPVASATESALGIGPGAPAANMTPMNSSIAPAVAPSAGNTFGVLGGLGPTMGLVGMGAMVGQQAITAKDELKNPRTATQGGVRAGLTSNPMTMWIPPVADALGLSIHSGKHPDQYRRDSVRGALQEQGYLDPNFKLNLEQSGLNLDLGRDGGASYTNAAGESRPVYNIDQNDPNAGQAIGWIKPLALLISDGDEKLASDFTAQIYNELTGDGKATDLGTIKARVLDLYHKFELKPSLLRSAIEGMTNVSDEQKNAVYAAIDNLRPGASANQGSGIPQFSATAAPKPQSAQPPTAALGTTALQGRPAPQAAPAQSEAPRRIGLRGNYGR